MEVIEKRLRDIKEGKIKGLSHKDFIRFLRKEGINV